MGLVAVAAAAGVKKAGRWLSRRLFGSGKKKSVAGKVADTALDVFGINPFPQPVLMPSGFQQGGGRSPFPQPKEGIVGRTISRFLPGGMTGDEWTPVEGTEEDKFGRPIAVHPATVERLSAPRGYVIVPGPDGEPIAMLKGAARAMGLWTARPKPPISGYDARAIRRAASAKKRVRKLAAKVGFTVTKRA